MKKSSITTFGSYFDRYIDLADDIELIDKMNKEGLLKIRNYVMVSLGIRNLDYYIKKET